jgi:hypothetical protein
MQAVLMGIDCPTCGQANRVFISGNRTGAPKCGKCGMEFFSKFAVIFGFIYVLSNITSPGLVRIGQTPGSVRRRVQHLSAGMGMPTPFQVEAYYLSQRPKDDVGRVHEELKNCHKLGREIFEIDPTQAIAKCTSILCRPPFFDRSKNKNYFEP